MVTHFNSDWCCKVNRSLPLCNAQLPRPFLHSTKMYQLNNWSSILSRSWWNPSTLLQVLMSENHHRCEIVKYLSIPWKAIMEETSTEGIWKYQIAEIGLWRAPTSVPVITQGRFLLKFLLNTLRLLLMIEPISLVYHTLPLEINYLKWTRTRGLSSSSFLQQQQNRTWQLSKNSAVFKAKELRQKNAYFATFADSQQRCCFLKNYIKMK